MRIICAITLAAWLAAPRVAHASNAVPLDYNWNGLAHASEKSTDPDTGDYRGISDRGLQIGTNPVTVDSVEPFGQPANPANFQDYHYISPSGLDYYFVEMADTPDLVFIGSREFGWDDIDDGDDHGIAPSWDPTGGSASLASATTTFASPTIALDSTFKLGVLFHVSNGGGSFDMTLGFTDATEVAVTLTAPDWYAQDSIKFVDPAAAGVFTQEILPGPLGPDPSFIDNQGFVGVHGRDLANDGPALNVLEAVITQSDLLGDLGFDVTGKQLAWITFDNPVPTVENSISATAILGASTTAEFITSVPAPAALPAGFAMIGLIGARRRRRS